MANQNNQQTEAQNQKSQDENVAIRYDLHNAYAFVEGHKSAQSFSAFTIEEAHDRFIDRVEGQSTPFRPNVLERIDRVARNVTATVAKVKSMDPDAFRRPDEDNVNTKENDWCCSGPKIRISTTTAAPKTCHHTETFCRIEIRRWL